MLQCKTKDFVALKIFRVQLRFDRLPSVHRLLPIAPRCLDLLRQDLIRVAASHLGQQEREDRASEAAADEDWEPSLDKKPYIYGGEE
jgi:hypothetical protein